MPVLQLKPRLTLQKKQIQKIILKLKLSNFVALAEKKFAEFVKEIENDSLFQKLMYPENKKEKAISYQRYPHCGLISGFFEFKEEITPAFSSAPEIESLLAEKKEIIPFCQKLGLEKFNKYFLYNQENLSLVEIASRCQLTLLETKKIFALVNEIAVKSEFYSPSTLNLEQKIHYTKIAALEKDRANNLVINYFSPFYARGKYFINYEKIQRLKEKNFFSREELIYLSQLLKNLELINEKKTTVYQVLENITKVQEKYLNSANSEDLLACTQREFARRTGLETSLISRAILGRSLVTPWGEEKPIKYFFPNKKEIRKNLLRKIIEEEKQPLTDEKIKNYLEKKFGIFISRRSVNVYCHELNKQR